MPFECDAIMKNDTWSLCTLPLGKKAIGTKWVYKLKCKPDGLQSQACGEKGYTQQKGIDFKETFAPTCCMFIVIVYWQLIMVEVYINWTSKLHF